MAPTGHLLAMRPQNHINRVCAPCALAALLLAACASRAQIGVWETRAPFPILATEVSAAAVGDKVYVIGHGGRAHALKARVIAKREFAGYWEYMIDDALFTAPAHPQWGGAALLDVRGRLVGIGSLLLQEAVGEESEQGNMFVPVDLIEPILADLLAHGRAARAPRPWLGMYTQEQAEGRLTVGGIAPGSPAERAGVQAGDLVLGVAGERTTSLADFLRKVWRLGDAGVEVPLMLARQGDVLRLSVRSADRNDFLKKPRLH